MIVGIGTDLVGVARFAASLRRTPALADRLFTPGELAGPRPVRSLAARFAAKEAAAKALGVRDAGFLDCEVVSEPDGRPGLRVTGSLAERARSSGVRQWHVSLTHDAELASAFVVAEG